MKRVPNVQTEMSLYILAYNLKRAVQILGDGRLMRAIRGSDTLALVTTTE